MRGRRALVAAFVLASACHRHGHPFDARLIPFDPAAEVCTPPAVQPLAVGVRADSLAGDYWLTLTAQSGPKAGSRTVAKMALQRYGSHIPPVAAGAGGTTRYPVYGWSAVFADSVGGRAPGNVAATDQDAPGILAVEWPLAGTAGAFNIMLRLGDRANRGGPTPIEGESLTLTVSEVTAKRFGGTWRSGKSVGGAAGYFCAFRR